MTRSSAPHIPAQLRQALRWRGAHLIDPDATAAHLGLAAGDWGGLGRHWDELCVDTYAGELGTTRLRRYGCFVVHPDGGHLDPAGHGEFRQPEDSNPLYLDRGRHFQPLTATFTDEPALRRLLLFLGGVAATMSAAARWSAKVHPLRVIATEAEAVGGRPTPEGLHRDGVTLVTTLLIARRNAVGGQSTVVDPDGRTVLAATLERPGTLLLADDRRTLHGVSAISPVTRGLPAVRDVLVITYAPLGPG